MTTILFTLVHYHNTVAIRDAIGRLRSLVVPPGWRAIVTVADNSGDAPDDLDAIVVSVGENRGYLGGAASALRKWQESHEGTPDWVVLTNPDVELRQDALIVLAETSIVSRIGIVAPSVLLAGTTPQNPFLSHRPSRARMRFYTIAFRSRVLTRALDGFLALKRRVVRARPASSVEPRAIYAPHGSIVFIRSLFFERGGTLGYGGFMYGEEIHLAEQARAHDLDVLFVPAIQVVHHGGSTTGRVEADRRREWHRASADVLWMEYFR
jgi:hypothetical protein